jgi:hypothetical protein
MAQPPVTAEIHESLYIHGDFPSQISFNCIFAYMASNSIQLHLTEILDLGNGIHARSHTDLAGAGAANAVDVGERNHRMFLYRNIYTSNTCHSFTRFLDHP